MAVQIQSGAGVTMQTVDPVSLAGRSTLYAPDGSLISKADMGVVVPGTTLGLALIGVEYKIAHLARSAPDGSLIYGDRLVHLEDNAEGAAIDTNKWIQTATTMTATQAAATGILLNAGASSVTTVGVQQVSHRFFPRGTRSALITRCRRRDTAHFSNNLIETGFGAPATATTASIGDGAVWRKTGSGDYVPVVSISGSESLGTTIDQATYLLAVPATDYAAFEVVVEEGRATFSITTLTGVTVSKQVVEFPANVPGFAVTHLQAMARTYNSGATGTAVQAFFDEIVVLTSDVTPNKPWAEAKAGQGYGGQTSPTAYTQVANYTNNTAPTTRTPSNTVAGEVTLGGQISWNSAGTSFAANDALDLILFGFQNPSPYGFMMKGFHLSTVNLGAANGAAVYTIQYFMALNASAVSLATAAPYKPMFQMIGYQTLANAAAIGTKFTDDIERSFTSGPYVFPGRFVVLGARVIGASVATLGQIIRTSWTPDGYFE